MFKNYRSLLTYKLDKDLFLAEYNSLRGEILQRISQQTTLYQIAITAFGLIIGYALEKVDPGNWYNSVILICIYPLLAFLLSYAWTFNQIRICQIAQYLRKRENEACSFLGRIGWENYIRKEPSFREDGKEPFSSQIKNRPGAMILSGTQVASICLAGMLLLIRVFTAAEPVDATQAGTTNQTMIYVAVIFLSIDILITCVTFLMIRRSGA